MSRRFAVPPPPAPGFQEPEAGPDTEPVSVFTPDAPRVAEVFFAEAALESPVEPAVPAEEPFEIVSEPEAAVSTEEVEVELEAEPTEQVVPGVPVAHSAPAPVADDAFALPAEERAAAGREALPRGERSRAVPGNGRAGAA